VEPVTVYNQTKKNDVFLADKITPLDQIKEDVADWEDPIIIVVARYARDDLLTFFSSTRDIQTRQTTKLPQPKLVPRPQL